MTVCVDTNVLVQLFGRQAPYLPILNALLSGELTLAVSNEILFEYQEVVAEMLGSAGWPRVVRVFDLMTQLNGNLLQVEPQFGFAVITVDPDDNKFCDCAITANADFVITEDRHFAPLADARYHPKPTTPKDFIAKILGRAIS